MTSRQTGAKIALAVGIAATASVALHGVARSDETAGACVGANVGRARNGYQTSFIDDQLNASAANAGDTLDLTARSTQRMSDAWWLDAGYFFSPYVGIDAAFLHLGEIRYVEVGKLGSGGIVEPFAATSEAISHGPALSLVLRLPLIDSLAVDLRVGDYLGKAILDNDIKVGANADFTAPAKTTSSLLAGVGVAYTIAGHWSVRANYLRVNKTGDSGTTGKFSVDLATAGVSYTF